MSKVSFNPNAIRARNARRVARFGTRVVVIDGAVIAVLLLAAVYLLSQHHQSGLSLVGLSLLVSIVTIWYQLDLVDDDAALPALNTDVVQLEKAVEPRLLAKLTPTNQPAELWQAAIQQWEAVFMINRLALPHQEIGALLQASPITTDQIWAKAIELAHAYAASLLDSAMVVAATLLVCPDLAPTLRREAILADDIVSVLTWQHHIAEAMSAAKKHRSAGGIGRDWATGYTVMLNRFAANLTREVEDGYYRFIPLDHSHLIDRLIDYLAQSAPVALVGGVGSGKTALMYGLADRLNRNDRAQGLAYFKVMALSASVLVSASDKLEDLVLQLIAEAAHSRNTILFLDDAQLFLAEGTGSVDLSQVLLPILQRRNLKIVLALTEHDWQQLNRRQPAFAGLLQRLVVSETSTADTVAILQDVAISTEHTAKVTVQQAALKEAVKLADRYLTELAFPGKAITVLEASAHYAESGCITPASVQQAVEATTGAKVTQATQPERDQLLNLEDQIHQRMVNQTHAVSVVASALRRARAGVTSPKRPIGSFLFLGPTGVGKTELAKALAAIYYGAESAMIRLDMSEYQQASDVARLLAASSDSQSGQTLVGAVRQRPSTVILLDEIEKAHPDVLNILLQLLDDGRLTDSSGRLVSFKDVILIATSNAAADEIRAHIEKGEALDHFSEAITKGLIASHQFKPELLNRFDEIVLFRPLAKEELAQVVNLLLAEVNTTLAAQSVSVRLTPAAIAWLVEHGYDPAFGARPLRRIVQRTVENVVAQKLLSGAASAGETIQLDVADLEPTSTTGSPSGPIAES